MVPHELVLSQHGATAYTDLLDAFLTLCYGIFGRCLMKIRIFGNFQDVLVKRMQKIKMPTEQPCLL